MLKELLDSPKCQFKLIVHYSNPQRFPQTSFQGRRTPAFEPFAKNKAINPEKGEVGTENNKTVTAKEELKFEGREELSINIESKTKTKNKQTTKTKTKDKATPPTIQKFSNYIKFIDYIPTHRIITYRHLFAYGFYIK